MHDIGRNAPCPCGSGRKYKQCCLRGAEVADHTAARLRAAEAEALPVLLEFADTFYGPYLFNQAWATFFAGAPDADADPNDPVVEALFVPWFLFDFVADPTVRRPRGQRVPPSTLGATFLELFPQKLSDLQRQFVRAAAGAPLSFHLVTEVRPGRGLGLEDILTGARHQVVERSGSTMLRAGSVLLARVVAMDGTAILAGCGPVPLTPIWRTHVLELRDRAALRLGVERLAAPHVRDIGLEILDLYLEAADAIRNPRPPKLVNTDGDPIEPTTLRYTLRCPPAEAFARLKTLSIHRDEERLLDGAKYDRRHQLRAFSLDWSKRGNRVHKEWDNTVLGHLTVDGASLTATVNSRRRARRLRQQIEKRLADAATFKAQVHERIEPLLEQASKGRVRGDPAAREQAEYDAQPPEVRAALAKMHADRWAQWIDDQIPALGNLTPREAAATEKGRERLEALLAEYSWNNERSAPHLRVDIAMLRARLGLAPARS